MPTSKQAKKRVRQSEKHRVRHKARRSELKTMLKKLTTTLKDEKDPPRAQSEFKALQVKLDKAVAAHTMSKNTVARRKSRLQRKINKLAKGGAAPKPAKS